MRQTSYPAGKTTVRKWYIVDVQDCILGRVSSRIASVLLGKEKCDLYVPYGNNASGVVVVNASKIKLTSEKKLDKPFYWHTGYPGGIKSRTMKERLTSKNPEQVLYKAVERMIPRNALGRAIMKNLRVFEGKDHIHGNLKPILWDLKSENEKNQIRKGNSNG